ncbi:hypothetical protein TSUD_317790 [Trifolium subterraneum]|uniref:Uncharacterized protein n=1 Tax=Trifolium subterraneum TaxID=3900 RepID=A0A2Z6M3Q5_TRISU|nr:hypothetical protein TSUD_317790 [Trifolium subterraneum]
MTIKVTRKEGESSGADGDVVPPPRVVTRTTRSSTATVADAGVDGDASNKAGITDKGEFVNADGVKEMSLCRKAEMLAIVWKHKCLKARMSML